MQPTCGIGQTFSQKIISQYMFTKSLATHSQHIRNTLAHQQHRNTLATQCGDSLMQPTCGIGQTISQKIISQYIFTKSIVSQYIFFLSPSTNQLSPSVYLCCKVNCIDFLEFQCRLHQAKKKRIDNNNKQTKNY